MLRRSKGVERLSGDLLKAGFYTYDNSVFISKQEALDRALVLGDQRPAIGFFFNDDVFSKIDWRQNPEQSLAELYAARARQLREKYDYLVLMFSGGADSDNVLDVFLGAGIHIDEVQTYYPVRALERIEAVSDPRHPLGTAFEYKLTVEPTLKRLATLAPRTKITVVDTTDFIERNWNHRFLSEISDSLRINATLVMPFKNYQMIETLNDLGRENVGAVYGSEKPHPYVRADELLFAFSDEARTAYHAQVYGFEARRFVPEQFYWTRDFPLIPIKQMHEIKRALRLQPKFKSLLINETAPAMTRRESEKYVNAAIYPRWDGTKYQKVVKNRDEQIAALILGSSKRVNSLLDARVSDLVSRYRRIDPAFGIKIEPELNERDHVESRTHSRSYSVGKINGEEA